MIIKKIFDFFSKYHHASISNYSKKLDFDILIDVGAHEGEFLSSFLKIKKIKRFYCFEPQSRIYEKLIINFKYIKKKIFFYNFPLGERSKKKKLFLHKLTNMSTMSSVNNKSIYLKFKKFVLMDYKKNKIIIVKQRKFDDVFRNIEIKKTYLKIDVEGYELNVLKGCLKKIKNVKYILIEHQFFSQYKNDFKKVKKFLKKNNFELLKTFAYFPTFHYRDMLYKRTP